MKSMEMISIAKVNLGLHITRRLPNGYHELETLFYPIADIFDELLLEKEEGNECQVKMQGLEEKITLQNNLCYKAFLQVKARFPDRIGGLGIQVRKGIPTGAGLGGGSSNAAAVMLGMRRLWDLPITDAELAELASPLGADIPFFIYGKPLYATGIGNQFESLALDLRGWRIEVRSLGLHSATPLAFQELDLAALQHEACLKDLLALPVPAWRGRVKNDLETSVFPRLSAVAEAKAQLYEDGAVYASMSGSGSSVYGIFKN